MSTQSPPAASRLFFTPTVLVTGFEPFAGRSSNPSADLARELDGTFVAGHRVVGRVLPVDTHGIASAFRTALAEAGEPALVLGTGLALGRTALAVERTAVNVLSFEIADNAGNVIREGLIHRNGDAARFAKLPLEDIVAAWRTAGIPGYISDTAGTYICNQLFYEVLALEDRPMLAGFLHVPASHELAISTGSRATPSLALTTMRTGVELLIATALEAGLGG